MASERMSDTSDFMGLQAEKEDVTPNNSDHKDPDYEPPGDQTTPKWNTGSAVYSTPSQRSNMGVSNATRDALNKLHIMLYENTGLPQERHCLITKKDRPLMICHVIPKAEKFETVGCNIPKLGG